jgi:hypothetical protein
MFSNKVSETIKKVRTVVRASRRLRVVLNGKGWYVEGFDALNNVVIHTEVTYLHPTEALRGHDHALARRINRKPVVLSRNLNMTAGFVEHRLVDTAMPILQLVCGEP